MHCGHNGIAHGRAERGGGGGSGWGGEAAVHCAAAHQGAQAGWQGDVHTRWPGTAAPRRPVGGRAGGRQAGRAASRPGVSAPTSHRPAAPTCRWKAWAHLPHTTGLSSPGILPSGGQPSKGLRQMPHTSSPASQVQAATACQRRMDTSSGMRARTPLLAGICLPAPPDHHTAPAANQHAWHCRQIARAGAGWTRLALRRERSTCTAW